MTLRHSRVAALAISLLLAGAAVAQSGSAGEHWVATWGTAMLQAAAFPGQPQPVGAQAAPSAAQQALGGFFSQTIRMVVQSSLGGRRARVQLSNAHGATPLVIGAAHIALRDKDSAIKPGTDRALTFGGKSTIMIPAGAKVVSDAVDLEIPALADLAVSLFVPGRTGPPTVHSVGLHTTYISPKAGDVTGQPAIADAVTTQSWYYLSGVDVLAPADAAAIVAFGDSITDGARSTPDTNRSWPSILAQRLRANPQTAHLAIVNQGISGNRVLRDQAGINALARFDRDVLDVAGAKWMILLEGINDIGQGARNNANAADVVTTDDVIAGLRQMVERAHRHGIKVIGATLTPYEGAGYASEKGEGIRQEVNTWIRTSGVFDAVVDFDAAVRDPSNPKRIRPEFDPGDHLHPNDAGYKAMAEAVDLSIFTRGAAAATSASR
jgi:lysophospholipase L1-like esterase